MSGLMRFCVTSVWSVYLMANSVMHMYNYSPQSPVSCLQSVVFDSFDLVCVWVDEVLCDVCVVSVPNG